MALKVQCVRYGQIFMLKKKELTLSTECEEVTDIMSQTSIIVLQKYLLRLAFKPSSSSLSPDVCECLMLLLSQALFIYLFFSKIDEINSQNVKKGNIFTCIFLLNLHTL